jgi:hypothetical protein
MKKQKTPFLDQKESENWPSFVPSPSLIEIDYKDAELRVLSIMGLPGTPKERQQQIEIKEEV